jgi:hypothetical protein
MQKVCTRPRRFSMTPILSDTLAPPSTADERSSPARGGGREHLDLALEQQARGLHAHVLRDARPSTRARGARRRRRRSRRRRRARRAPARSRGRSSPPRDGSAGSRGRRRRPASRGDETLRRVADAVGASVTGSFASARAVRDRPQRELRLRRALRAAEVGREDQPPAAFRSDRIVGSVASIRVASVMRPPSSGTLKSARTNTR